MSTSTGRATITLTGVSGNQYQLALFPWGTQFQTACVVYAIFAQRPDGYHVLYVGQTGNCAERFDAHHKAISFRAQGVTHTGLFVENSERLRLTMEADLIARYNPPCNG